VYERRRRRASTVLKELGSGFLKLWTGSVFVKLQRTSLTQCVVPPAQVSYG
jgi:zona occludens toxin (predicted ATPase)